jgi:hypothetical protein
MAPVTIGSQLYCATCGTLLSTSHAASKSATDLNGRAKRSRVLDLRPDPPATVEKPGGHATPAAPPQSTANTRHQAHFTDRFARAKTVERSPQIQRFNSARLPSPHPDTHHQTVSLGPELPNHAVTQHAAMAKLAATAPAPAPVTPAKPKAHRPVSSGWRPHLKLSPNAQRTATVAAAVAIMGGYIWFQNYPKLALHNANSQAGISASLPAYLPSSYNLKHTTVKPGAVTLSFFSPSSDEALKIAQTRTDWDSSSLLDNYVAQRADDYATVQNQGLTIYLFNNNQATWVNHGLWYSIEGASRLSREQILKIAYSL